MKLYFEQIEILAGARSSERCDFAGYLVDITV